MRQIPVSSRRRRIPLLIASVSSRASSFVPSQASASESATEIGGFRGHRGATGEVRGVVVEYIPSVAGGCISGLDSSGVVAHSIAGDQTSAPYAMDANAVEGHGIAGDHTSVPGTRRAASNAAGRIAVCSITGDRTPRLALNAGAAVVGVVCRASFDHAANVDSDAIEVPIGVHVSDGATTA